MKILIGSCGGLTGSYLSRKFKEKGHIVFGFDSNIINQTKFFLDDFFTVPKFSEGNYIDEVIRLLNDNNIDLYIPTHSKEIKLVSKNENYIKEKWNGFFIVSPNFTYEKLSNKASSYIKLKEIGIPVPKLFDNNETPRKFPIFMKPNEASGSRGSQIVENETLLNEYRKLYPDNCFIEYIDGREYTVDCFFDNDGELVAINQRQRVKNMGGAVIITKNDYSFDITPYINKIASKFVLKGCVNFQYILKEDTPYFIDVNLRYASGGLPLTVKSGIDIPQMMIDLSKGEKISCVSNGNDGLIMYRYFNEIYEEDIN